MQAEVASAFGPAPAALALAGALVHQNEQIGCPERSQWAEPPLASENGIGQGLVAAQGAAGMAEQNLDHPNTRVSLKEMGREAMPERM